MAGIQYYNFTQSQTAIPAESSATTHTFGFNTVSGSLEQLILHQTLKITAGTRASDQTAYVSALRIVADGEQVFDFRAGFDATTGGANLAGAGAMGVLINSIGGRAYTIPSNDSSTDVESWWSIPVGKNLGMNGTVSRIEITIEYYAYGLAVSSGVLEVWGRYNSNATKSVRVLSPQSYIHSASTLEQVNLKTSPNVAGVIDGIWVQNSVSTSDNIGSQGIRLMSQSQFPMPLSLWRHLNGDVMNGIMYDDPEGLATFEDAQSFTAKRTGCLFIPTYGLVVDGDLTLFVDQDGTGTTRTYSLIKVAPFGAGTTQNDRQTVKSSANYQKDILSRAESGA